MDKIVTYQELKEESLMSSFLDLVLRVNGYGSVRCQDIISKKEVLHIYGGDKYTKEGIELIKTTFKL